MGAKTHNLAIVFADISGSTRLYDQLGDVRAREIVSSTLDLLFKVVHQHHGKVIKTIGDEIMATFPDAELAGNATCEMQEAIEEDNETHDRSPPVAIRIGFQFGQALLENGDVHGDAVNVAARMAAQANARQIITTRSTADTMSPALQENTRFVDLAHVKGKGEVEIVELLWQQEDVTRMTANVRTGSTGGGMPTLQLRYHDETITLDADRRSAVLGRSPICDIRVNENLASRQHVRVELRRDKYMLVDQSTNGTYVRGRDGTVAFLRREEMPFLEGTEVSLGRGFEDNPEEVVRFEFQTP